MVASVADVDGEFPVYGFKHGPSGVPFHVVRGFVEVPNPWDVILAMLADNVPCANAAR